MHVHYGFLTLGPADEETSDDATRGQQNGLCGAALPGRLHLITGLHTGHVGVRIELHSAEPPVGDEWEEAVEAAFATTATDLTLRGFHDGATCRAVDTSGSSSAGERPPPGPTRSPLCWPSWGSRPGSTRRSCTVCDRCCATSRRGP